MSSMRASRYLVFRLCGAAVLALSAPVAAAHEAEEMRPPVWDMIAFEVKSWGNTVHRWQFTPEYGGVWIENVAADGMPTGPASYAFHPLDADGARYAMLEAIALKLPDPAPESDRCENFVTDMPYGTIRLTRGATTTEIAWNAGCMDEDYAAFSALLRQADELVSGWGKAAPVGRTDTRPD